MGKDEVSGSGLKLENTSKTENTQTEVTQKDPVPSESAKPGIPNNVSFLIKEENREEKTETKLAPDQGTRIVEKQRSSFLESETVIRKFPISETKPVAEISPYEDVVKPEESTKQNGEGSSQPEEDQSENTPSKLSILLQKLLAQVRSIPEGERKKMGLALLGFILVTTFLVWITTPQSKQPDVPTKTAEKAVVEPVRTPIEIELPPSPEEKPQPPSPNRAQWLPITKEQFLQDLSRSMSGTKFDH